MPRSNYLVHCHNDIHFTYTLYPTGRGLGGICKNRRPGDICKNRQLQLKFHHQELVSIDKLTFVANSDVLRCDFEVFFYQDATVDKCIKSAHGACSQAEAKSISAWSGSGEPIPQSISRIPGEVGKSIKITRKKYSSEVFQFEYNLIEKEGKLYFDLSDLDGKSPSVSGSPFYEFNVKATPHGIGVGDGTCATIRCEAEEICEEAYQTPTDEATKVSSPASQVSKSY